MNNIKSIVIGACTLVEIGCIATLAAVAIKRNNEAYEAEKECTVLTIRNLVKDLQIDDLKREVKDLKDKYENKEES